MVERARIKNYAISFLGGLVIFVAMPLAARWINGGAFAQQLTVPENTYIGNAINGHADYSATGSPGQTAPVIGGSSSVTACPGQMAPGSNVIGTYVGPGSSMSATASSGGGNGTVIGYQSSVTIGGPGCQ